MLTENIPHLGIEDNEDGTVTLEQDWSGNVDRVTLHALQVRFLAERAGLVREVSASEADTLRAVAMLKRRMRVLLDRIDRLDDMVRAAAAKGHEDLEVETTFSYATWELATEFCADLDDIAPCPAAVTRDTTVTKPTANPAETQLVLA
jgi:hypothetical protein